MNTKPSFAQSMFTKHTSEEEYWSLIENSYQKYINNIDQESKLYIPKIIHQIWLGSPLPENLKILQKTWQQKHPDWEYHLWTDKDIEKIGLEKIELYKKTKNFGAKSDILRYELLYKFGGLYVDTDFECLKSFSGLHHLTDFYAGIFSPGKICINNGLIGASPKHPIIKNCIQQLRLPKEIAEQNLGLKILEATGPRLLTRCILEFIKQKDCRCLILPSSYFYPSPNSNSGASEHYQKGFIKPETYAIHYWHVSWSKQAGWKKFIKKILNKHNG